VAKKAKSLTWLGIVLDAVTIWRCNVVVVQRILSVWRNSMTTKKATAKKSASKKTASKKTATKKAAAKKAPAKKAAKKSSTRKYSPSAGKNVETEMREMKKGTLKSGRSGKKVTNPKQAIAIGLSEARKAGKTVPPPPKKG
jgi:pyruvate/2-oxoglutarate dehydrogenase complex dihydrolipoamide acyltransferase (E2) component